MWPNVEAIEGAHEALKALSEHHTIYVATSAQDSKESEIQAAFQRVGLDPYINGYFFASPILGSVRVERSSTKPLLKAWMSPASNW
ncbi:hypothetical protein QW180_27240 [Vibrio sinaloensis]|nr:hypothetical protein [Vibrio sinaloensis]